MTDILKLKELVDSTEKVMAQNMARMIYVDNAALPKLPPLTFMQRVKLYAGRAKDAWLVLTGKLDPYEY